jgi:hypothetical protein
MNMCNMHMHNVVTASLTYGYILSHVWLQPA